MARIKATNSRVITSLITFLAGMLLVYLIDGAVAPVWADLSGEQYADRCYH